MKYSRIRIAITLFSLMLACPWISAQEGRRMTPAPMFQELENKWMTAYQKKDTGTLDPMLAEEFTLSDQRMITRDEYLELMKKTRVSSFRIEDLAARVYCNTGVIKFRLQWEASVEGKSRSGTFLVTDIWNETTDGQWRVIARHMSASSE